MRKAALVFFAVAVAMATIPNVASAEDKQACIKRQMAKGRSACLARLQCDGVTSRKEQARRCGG
jgi:hypothetical protein